MPLLPTVLLRRPTVLVVDDEESLRHYLRRVLEEDGYQVLTACDGAHALSLLQRSRSPVQLVITDVSMPTMNGLELAAHIGLQPSPPSVVFMSGGHHSADVPGPLLSKPFRAHEVSDLARLILTRRAGSAPPLQLHGCA
jgi:CheY-like chemotaxis protein